METQKKEKMNENVLKTLAIFMSCLMIAIPFYVSSVTAASGTVNIINITGEHGIEKMRKGQDDYINVTVEVIGNMPVGTTMSPDEVRIRYAVGLGSDGFTQCTLVEPPHRYICSFKSPINNVLPSNAGKDLVVCLSGSGGTSGCCYSDCNPSSCSQTSCFSTDKYYVDALGPEVSSLEASPSLTNGNNITVSYTVSDRLCSGCTGRCSGLKKLELFDSINDHVLAEEDINSQPNDCSRTGTLTLEASDLSDGEHEICMYAYDNVDHKSTGTECFDVIKDDTIPNINSFGFYDSTGTTKIGYIKPSGTEAKFVVNVTTSDLLEVDKAVADLTGFGLGIVTLSCEGNAGDWFCSDDVNLDSAVTEDVVVNITDNAGNNYIKSDTIQISLDDVAPVVDRVHTSFTWNNTGFLRPGSNNITAIINETGVGLAGNNVYIDVDNTGDVQAECSDLGDNRWGCSIYDVSVTGDAVVKVTGQDDSGNPMDQYSATLKYDDEQPSFSSLKIRNIADENQGLPFVAEGDDVLITGIFSDNSAMKTDDGKIEVYGSFEGFPSSEWVNAVDCQYTNNIDPVSGNPEWNCTWELINAQAGPISASLNFSDIVGNYNPDYESADLTTFLMEYWDDATNRFVTIEVPDFEVYSLEENTTPNYWTSEILRMSPNPVNSKVTQYIPADVWLSLQLSSTFQDVVIKSLVLDGCGEITNQSTDYASFADDSRTTIVNPTLNSTFPWLRIGLKVGAISKPNLKFNCTMNIVSLRGNKLSYVEKEKINISIPTVLKDDIGDSLNDEIDRVKHGWIIRATTDWVPMLAKVLGIANDLCNILYAFRSILDALALTNIITAGTEGTVLHPIGAAADAAAAGGEAAHVGIWTKVYKYCDYLSCRRSYCKPDGSSGDARDNKFCDLWTTDKGQDFMTAWNKWAGNELMKIPGASHVGGVTFGVLDKLNFISSNAPQCTNANRKWSDGDCDPDMAQYSQGSPTDTMVGAVANLCLQGIINNMLKARQIECAYLYCLAKQVPGGMPVQFCTTMRSYSWCLIFWGELFQFVPFASFIKSSLASIKSFFENPLGLVMGMAFQQFCNYPHWATAGTCRLLQAYQGYQQLERIYEKYQDQENLLDINDDLCKLAMEDDD